VLRNQDVMEMLVAGLDSEIVVEKIRSANCAFDVTPTLCGAKRLWQSTGYGDQGNL